MSSISLLAIDPGPTESAIVVWKRGAPHRWAKKSNSGIFLWMVEEWELHPIRLRNSDPPPPVLVIEQVASMGMAVGEEVFETVFWSGKFAQAWRELGGHYDRMKRHEVKSHLCHHPRAKDGNIRQALIDRWGGKDKAIGRKASPGPLYGMSGDCWQALALAVTYWDTRIEPTGGDR